MEVLCVKCLIALWILSLSGAQQLTLTSQPPTSGAYCPGPVNFTCVGTQVDAALFWQINGSTVVIYVFQSSDTFPVPLHVNTPLDGVMFVITSASISFNTIDITSVLRVNDVSVLNGASLQCVTSIIQSNLHLIQVQVLTTPPSPSSTSCSLLPSLGGAEVSLQWSPSFTSQHAVERYHVSVTPDPSSCSSDQVSPTEDYSCSGLVLGTPYTFTLCAINCRDQEGNTGTLTVLVQAPPTPTILIVGTSDVTVLQWSSVPISERCSFDPLLNYTVVLEDSTGRILDQRVVVSSDSCNDSCSIPFSPSSFSETCRVGVRASNVFTQSDTQYFITAGRLSTANQVLLSIGVAVLSLAVVICICLVVRETKTKKGCRLSLVLLVVGGILVVVSVVLWVAVALQVGLQRDTCDSTWQSTRNQLITAAHTCSDVALLVLMMGMLSFSSQCHKTLCKNHKKHIAGNAEISESGVEEAAYEVPTTASRMHMGAASDSSVGRIAVQQNQVYGIGDGIEMKQNQVYGIGDGMEMKQNQVYGTRA